MRRSVIESMSSNSCLPYQIFERRYIALPLERTRSASVGSHPIGGRPPWHIGVFPLKPVYIDDSKNYWSRCGCLCRPLQDSGFFAVFRGSFCWMAHYCGGLDDKGFCLGKMKSSSTLFLGLLSIDDAHNALRADFCVWKSTIVENSVISNALCFGEGGEWVRVGGWNVSRSWVSESLLRTSWHSERRRIPVGGRA